MANPRQRRKARSGGATKPSANSKRLMQKRLHKHGAVLQGPAAVLNDHWDRHKTVAQNFRSMGLLSNVKMNPSGGREYDAEHIAQRAREAVAGSSKPDADLLPSRKARIVRDEDGNVLEVIEEDEPTYEEKLAQTKPGQIPAPQGRVNKESINTPWGHPLNDSDDEDVARVENEDSGSEYEVGGVDLSGGLGRFAKESGRALGKAKELTPAERQARDRAVLLPPRQEEVTPEVAKMHAKLEALAAERASHTVPRHTSAREDEWLRTLIAKHGDDLDAASKDRLANPWQKTKGEIRRAIKKAGGVEKIMSRQ